MIVTLDNLGASGYLPDMPAHTLPEDPLGWSSISNMKFRAGMAERTEGYAAAFDTTPTEVCYGLFAATKSDGTPYLVGCADAAVYTYNGTTEYNMTGAVTVAATADTKWTGGLLTGLLCLNDSVNDPVYVAVSTFGGTPALAALSNWPSNTKCKVLRPFKYFLVAGHMVESSTTYPFKVRWSASATPGTLPSTWVAAASNDAGSVDLSADDGPIIDMVPFGDQLAIFRESGITMMRYTGDSAVMAFNRVPSAAGSGLVGNNCAVEIPGIGIVAISASDVYAFNGQTTQSILDKRMRRWFISNISTSNSKRSFIVHHASKSEVWACFPSAGASACDKAIIWNYSENTLGIRDLPNCTAGVHAVVQEQSSTTWASATGTWADQSGTWDSYDALSLERKTVLASTANKLYVVGNAQDAAGTGITSQLERQYISLGDNQRVKYIRGIWPRFDATAGQTFEITVGASMAVDESPSWGSAATYTIGSSRFVPVNQTGRFLSLRIRNTSGPAWRLKSMDVDIQPRGLW